MRVLFLGSGRSIHVIRWAKAIATRGHEVYLATQDELREPTPECAGVHLLPRSGALGYLLNVRAVRRLIAQLGPDLIHTHYATGYGTLARMAAGSVPILLSVYGSDVLAFPHQGRLQRALLIRNLKKAQVITSASQALAQVVTELTPTATVALVPFGIDTSKFRPIQIPRGAELIVGTVKGLDPVYGIDILLRAFAALPKRGSSPLKLVVAGTGPADRDLRALSEKLGIAEATTFLGDVPHADVPRLLNTFSVYAALSRSESFGVAVAEASACGIPVVATRIGGLSEVVQDGVTGLLVPPEDPQAAADAIARLLTDPQQGLAMGSAGRDFVRTTYEWELCVDAMLQAYEVACSGGPHPRYGDSGLSAMRDRVSIDS